MKKSLLFLGVVCTLLLVPVVSGQIHRGDGDTLSETLLGRSFFMGGVAWLDLDELNSRMNALGLTEFSEYGLSLAIGWDMIFNRMVSGGELEGIFWRTNETDGVRQKFWAGRLLFNSGFQILSSDRIFLYPLLGLGGGIARLWIGPEQISFDDALAIQSPDPLYQFTVVINLGVGFDVLFPLWRGYKNILLGFRGGYMFDPVRSSRWYRGGPDITGGPDVNVQGPYIQVVLGKGVRWRSRRAERMKMSNKTESVHK